MTAEKDSILNEIAEALTGLDLGGAIEGVQKALELGTTPQTIIKGGMGVGLDVVGKKFADGEFFLSDLIFAGHIMKEATAILEPHLDSEASESEGVIVFATVEGDLHDIGKNITSTMLKSVGFKVVDLGVDVPAAEIVRVAEEEEADIVALSALLSVVEPYVVDTIKALKESKVGDRTKVLLGGRAVEAGMAERVKADAYALDAWDGIAKARELVKKAR
jgi:5-methyltetrahydrofolate--homocysteine methyltransferase